MPNDLFLLLVLVPAPAGPGLRPDVMQRGYSPLLFSLISLGRPWRSQGLLIDCTCNFEFQLRQNHSPMSDSCK
jgi:hypothetical protein